MDRLPAQGMTGSEVERLVRGTKPLVVQVGRNGVAEPALDDLAAEFGDSVHLLTVSSEDASGLADSLRLEFLPGMLLLKGGEVFDRFLGRLPRRLVVARVRAMLDAA
jgi:hypothetical protein